MEKYWLFSYDDLAPCLSIVDYGAKEEIRNRISELLKGCSYVRQWVDDGMTILDYGSHVHFLKVYPAFDVFVI